MGVLEIVLLAAGAIAFLASFCIPVKQEKLAEETKKLAESEVKSLVSAELENVRGRLSELSEEEMQQQIEKSERSMERISNEKIMAVNEYSDTVLDEIHKNHEEVVFLYDMLKDKKEKVQEKFSDTDKSLKDLLQQVKDSEITVRENLEKLEKKQEEVGSRLAEEQKEAAGEAAYAARTPQTGAAPFQAQAAGESAQAPVFRPFTPERVEARPGRAEAKKQVKKPAREETAQGQSIRGSAPEQFIQASPPRAESADVELLFSSDGAAGGKNNSNERILELHKAGKSNMAIAKELGLGIGEVKLVIDLYEVLR